MSPANDTHRPTRGTRGTTKPQRNVDEGKRNKSPLDLNFVHEDGDLQRYRGLGYGVTPQRL